MEARDIKNNEGVFLIIMDFPFRMLKFLVVLFLSLILLYFIALLPPRNFYYKVKQDKTYTGINYHSLPGDLIQQPIKEIKQENVPGPKDISISFNMRVENIDGDNDVFQTAPLNSGIRMELNKPSTVALIIRSSDGGYRRYCLTNSLELNKLYFVKISVDKMRHLKILLDNKIIFDEKAKIMKFDVSDIKVGSGFDGSRFFKGSISDFDLHLKVFEKRKIFRMFTLCLMIMFTGIIFLSVWIKRQKIICGAYHCTQFIFGYPLDRGDKIKLCCLIICVGFFSSVAFHYVRECIYSQGYPLNTFLSTPSSGLFGDFRSTFNAWHKMEFSGTGIFFTYFPAAFMIVDIFTKLGSWQTALVLYLLVFSTLLFIYAYSNLKTKNKLESLQNAFIFAFLSYPFLFTVATGNFEIFVFIFLCFFIILYSRGSILLSLIFLAMSISMKLFPAVFLILLISDKKYKESLYTVLFVFLLSFIPLLIFDGGINTGLGNYLFRLTDSLNAWNNLFVVDGLGLAYGNSALTAVRVLAANAFPPVKSIMMPYAVVAILVFFLISLYVIFREKIFWKKVAILIIAMNLLPYVSADYKLLHLFIPFFLFINYLKKEKFDLIFCLLFSLLMIPKDYFYFNNNPGMTSHCATIYFNNNPAITFNCVANPIIMLVMLFLIIFSGIKANPKSI